MALATEVAVDAPFFEGGKRVASICHGPWTVIEADAARGRRVDFVAVTLD